ncbi:MAG: Fe-S cluster assembly sulfur transfer protein SufU [Thermodesulfobacteriota bacterium]
MLDLQELYQEVIVDHNRSPRNFQKLEDANRTAEGYNPLCGDQLTVYMKVVDDIIEEVTFEGAGCAISVASASLMTLQIKGKREEAASALFQGFHKMVTEEGEQPPDKSMGKLAVLAGVKRFPSRIKCATLCWHTMKAAMKGDKETVVTE